MVMCVYDVLTASTAANECDYVGIATLATAELCRRLTIGLRHGNNDNKVS